jgi:putative DNA primase/helicase
MNAKFQSSNRPTPLEVNDAGIPNELKARDQWLNWHYEERTDARGNSRFTKVPKMPSGQPARTTDRSTWSSYADCHAAYREGAFDGIGIVIADDDDLGFADFDHIVRPDTPTPDWVRDIIEAAKLENAYIEVSVGGDGVHVIGKIKKFTAGRRVGALELYPSGRFSTITGHAIHKPETIGTLDRTLELICRQLGITRDELYAPAPKSRAINSAEHRKCPASDEQILEKAQISKNHVKFKQLFFEGETHGYNSPSEADLALAGLLAFWTGPDPEAIERLMRQSKLLRPKWDDHRSYLVDTILHALEGRNEFYAWQSIIHPSTTVTARSSTNDTPAQIDSVVYPMQTSAAGGLIAPYSDSANSHLLVQKFGSEIRFTEGSGWMVFSYTHFFRDPEGVRIMAIAKSTASQLFASAQHAPDRDAAIKHAKQTQNRRALESMEVLARAEPGVLANINDFDADPWLLNVQNGTIDLRTRQLRPHRAADLISKIAGTHYDPSATAPIWHQFLDRVMAGDHKLISYLQRVIGYSLTGFSNERALHFFYGDGANGKSVFSEVILHLFGCYGLVLGSDLLMARIPGAIPNDIAALRGQRVVFLNETQ